ncbi:MAG: GNAT family N-acetyltransferase [Solirubrobacteraceae bacterium]
MSAAALLERVEAYLDELPRAAATVEDHGSLRLFVGTGAWPYYARPRPGHAPVTAEDIALVRARQRELGAPEKLEWIVDTTPSAEAAACAAGLEVERFPLLVLDRPLAAAPVAGVTVRVLDADDRALPATQAAVAVGFGSPGTTVGEAGVREREHQLAARDPRADVFVAHQIRAGHAVMAVAEDADGPACGGTALPRGAVSELVGIATLPSARRRGIAALVVAALVDAVAALGVTTTFMGAADEDVARVYGRVGFRPFATACEAAPPR